MTLVSTQRLYSGRVVNLDLDTVEFPDGSTGTLEILRHSGASAVVPFLDDVGSRDPRVLLIRQFRHAADRFIWEVPAGRLDPGETPERCAERELEEETGRRAGRLERLTTIFTTPGFTDEKIHLFVAHDLADGPGAPRGRRVHGAARAALVGRDGVDSHGRNRRREDPDFAAVRPRLFERPLIVRGSVPPSS